ncbi:MAG: VCBS repeat-containing protein [Verrucomicrobiales bacterium]|nr:VCBS repeat-containing protein [Verrucomicrobiales bacterium]
MKIQRLCCLLSFILLQGNAAEEFFLPAFSWTTEEIDQIEIGYGLQLVDINGDGKTDILLADKSTVQWYENPGWEKHIIAENLTVRDNVCIAARDIDGDGKAEIAVGGQWNFLETMKDGAVHYLVAPEDRTRPWKPVKLYNDPSVHRMHWITGANGGHSLAVKPLRGKGSIDGVGPGLRILNYFVPGDPTAEWETEVISDFLHLSHNFHPVNWDEDPEEELIVAAKEGVWYHDRVEDVWETGQLTDEFAGEVRDGTLPNGRRFIATVEPMHGTACAVYLEPENGKGIWPRLSLLDDAIKDGHALACADFLGNGSDQIMVGWRAMHPKEVPGEPGIKLFYPLNASGNEWGETSISGEEIAVEDIKAADLNGDNKPDLVAAGRKTKNLRIFFNTTPTF